MYNIKIKSVPNRAKTGQQLDYSLVDRNTLFLKPDTQVQSDVKNTISAVPRDKANIEAEGGETIIGDTNNDGFLEHQTIVGKRHSKGGVPLNVPEGSFIFSDTDKLRIKDPEILKMFGMPANKKGYTPAEIAKKYQVNDYMAILKDNTKDKYSKETAQVMLDSNLKKLGMLALVQESMKGFPDGVPAIAESVMEGMMGGGPAEQQEEEQQGQPQARYGGTQLPKAQFGVPLYGSIPLSMPSTIIPTDEENAETTKNETTTTEGEPDWDYSEDTMYTAPGAIPLDEVVIRQQKLSAIPKIGDVYYVDGQPIKVSDIEMSSAGDWLPNWLNDPQGIYFSPAGTTDYGSKNKKYYLTFDEFKALRKLDPNTGNAPVLKKHGRTASSWWTADDNRAYNFSTVPTTQPTRYYGSKGDNISISQNDILELPNGKYKVIDTQYGVNEENPLVEPKAFFLPGQFLETIRAKNLTTGQVEELRLDELKEKIDAGFAMNLTKDLTTNPDGTPKKQKMKFSGDDADKDSMGNDEVQKEEEVGKPKPDESTKSATGKSKVNTKNTSSPFNPIYAGFETATDTVKAYGGSIQKMQTGGTKKFNPDTGMWQNYDAQGKPVGAPYPGTGTTYNVKDKDLLEKARAAGYEVISNKYAPNVNYVPEQTAATGFTWNPESGYYESKDLTIGKQGLEETINIWKDELDQYSGPSGKGAEAWRKDFLGQKGKEGPASKYLVDKANEYSVAAGFGPQVDVTKKAAYVPGSDVSNLKKFKKVSPAKVEQKTDDVKTNTDVNVQQKTITPSITNRTRGWFTPDVLNLANAFGRRIGKFPPTLRQVDFQTGPYNLLSPEGEIAKIQSTGNMLSNQAANTMAGNVGFGASLGVQGQAIDKVTDTQGKYSNADVGISNEASRFGSGIFNQGQLTNTQLRSAFDRDTAIYGQQRVNALNRKDDAMTRAYNQAWGNAFKANMLEDMFPQVGIDRVYGNIGWSGVGRNPFGVDTYINPLTTAQAAKGKKGYADYDLDDDDWNEISAMTEKGMLNGMSKDQANSFATKMIMAKKSRNNVYDPYNPAQSVYAGLGSMGWDNTDRY
jgi:hypothetical protein